MKSCIGTITLLSFLALGGCLESGQDPIQLTPGAIESVESTTHDEAIDEAFGVPLAAQRAFALGWVSGHDQLRSPGICFELPVLDRNGRLIATQFVLSDSVGCRSFDDLLGEASPLLAQAADLRARTRRAEEAYFTLSVSAHAFRHPLHDGVKGLPFWLLTRDRLPAAFDPSEAVPVALLPQGPGGGLMEVVRYRTPGGERLFSHHAAREVRPRELQAVYRPARVLVRWRETLQRKYPLTWPDRVENRRSVWRAHLGDAAGRTP